MHLTPPDHALRERFARETDRNFSLLCPAGSGKTHSLTSRVVALAARPDAARILPRLTVVTYTRRAADEMRARARSALASAGIDCAVQHAFTQAFYGTIHSFAVELLRTYGHHLGVPCAFEVVQDDAALWEDFLHRPELNEVLSTPLARRMSRLVPLTDLCDLARIWDFSRPAPDAAGPMPAIDFSPVLTFPTPKRADTAANIRRAQSEFQCFAEAINGEGDAFVGVPRPTKGGKEFLAACRSTSAPLLKWIAAASAEVARDVARAFRAHRIARGALSYDDQVQLAVELMRHPAAAREIRARGFRVLLDEAQDTDPSQFEFLLEAVRPVEATGRWSEGSHPPAPGRFVMVGDPQQSIYSARADLATYLAVHSYLSRPEVGEALAFGVTFRCDRDIIAFANAVFPATLDGQSGQVSYVELQPRPEAGEGQVVRLRAPGPSGEETDVQRAASEAEFVAQSLASAGLSGLRARSWGQVAILCPRKRWFPALRDALRRHGIESQLLSTRSSNADGPAYAWFTAIAYVLGAPSDGYEVCGVLREAFGVSDAALAAYTAGDGSHLNLHREPEGEGEVERALRTLVRLRSECANLPVRAQAQRIADLISPRLAALPVEQGAIRADLQRLLLSASGAEAAGMAMEDFVERLLADWTTVPDEVEDPDRLSVITNLKAKGLEWDCVVVPYLFREISDPPPSYPRLIGRHASKPAVIFGRDELPPGEADAEELLQVQELHRLLYVTCTRPRRTLVLVDDRELFAPDAAPKLCAASALRLCDHNKAAWDALRPAPIGQGSVADESTPEAAAPEAAPDLEAAREAARRFAPLLRPSSMNTVPASQEESEQRTISVRRDLSLEYGSWWHECMRAMPWAEGRAAWEAVFAAHLEASPDRERARREWRLFLESTLANRLAQTGILAVAEAPCRIPTERGTIDGVIDLAILGSEGTGWFVVDWKTSSYSDPEAYRPQLTTYAAALRAATGLPCRTAVFFTGSGEEVMLGEDAPTEAAMTVALSHSITYR